MKLTSTAHASYFKVTRIIVLPTLLVTHTYIIPYELAKADFKVIIKRCDNFMCFHRIKLPVFKLFKGYGKKTKYCLVHISKFIEIVDEESLSKLFNSGNW